MNVMKQYFKMLEDSNILYVHFKSNNSLSKSFDGKGDFDVLVEGHRMAENEQILLSLNAKRFNSIKYGIYPGVDNWLLFDYDTGTLYHLHLHYQICTGKEMVKDYIIPWDKILYSTRIRDENYGIFISSPELEYLLLNVRIVLKSKVKNYISAALGVYSLFPSLKAERDYLYQVVDWNLISLYCEKLISKENNHIFFELLKEPVVKGRSFLKLNSVVRHELKKNRRMSGISASIKSAMLWFEKRKDLVMSRKLNSRRIIRKTSLSGGRIIAFVGVDGAGKSTTTQAITKWLSHKVECTRFYMGTGDGKVTLFARLIKALKKLFRRETPERKANANNQESRTPQKAVSFAGSPLRYISRLSKAKMIYSIEKANTKKIRMMHKYRLNGGTSFLDRFPQIEIEGCNDGPKISAMRTLFQNPSVLDGLIEKEKKELSIVQSIMPDVVFRLQITAEESMRRKPEQTDIEVYREKKRLIDAINFQGATIIDIDAQVPYDEELLMIKRRIWELF